MDQSIPSSHLDVRAFARTAGLLHGHAPLSAFSRVAQDCIDGGAGAEVDWSAQGEMRGVEPDQAQVWLHLKARADVPLTCQRCLEMVSVELVVDQAFRFVADEETAEQEDDDALEDLLVLSGEFDLRQLLEDELVLAMPLIASHVACPAQPALSVQDPDFEDTAHRPNPFAVLGGLKSVKGGRSD